jgi:hypothetical protein
MTISMEFLAKLVRERFNSDPNAIEFIADALTDQDERARFVAAIARGPEEITPKAGLN